ncbi:UNKNOWN [Stylonychia lemnae]|uniref:Uncharacterized protein n=1 Tax=Stylonychia lemnae TaxID=5949 RepID=A0A078AIR6_STYLE|nr:UNKNOWN [Stylonychia lemnae]|eukprot:CDW82170.1 UNKNOWN [Stylonychia lemnae]
MITETIKFDQSGEENKKILLIINDSKEKSGHQGQISNFKQDRLQRNIYLNHKLKNLKEIKYRSTHFKNRKTDKLQNNYNYQDETVDQIEEDIIAMLRNQSQLKQSFDLNTQKTLYRGQTTDERSQNSLIKQKIENSKKQNVEQTKKNALQSNTQIGPNKKFTVPNANNKFYQSPIKGQRRLAHSNIAPQIQSTSKATFYSQFQNQYDSAHSFREGRSLSNIRQNLYNDHTRNNQLTPIRMRQDANKTSLNLRTNNQDSLKSINGQSITNLNWQFKNEQSQDSIDQIMRSNPRLVSKVLIAEPQIDDKKKAIKLTLYSSIEQASQNNLNKFRTTSSKFISRIPKSYYNNYRAAKLRETLESEERKKIESQYHRDGYECTHEVCNCQFELDKKEQLRVKSRSPSPPIISLYRKQKEFSDRLSNPYQACRKCCSTSHNPFYHHLKLTKRKNQNMQSTNRLLLVQTKWIEQRDDDKRACSADSGKRRKNKENLAIDWQISSIYKDIIQSKKARKQSGASEKLQNILLKKYPDSDLDIYTEMEVQYHQSILKQKLHEKDIVPLNELHLIFQKAMRTLKFQMKKLLLIKTYNVIEETYQTNENKETINNCIKLLLRSKKTFDAEQQIKKALKNILLREKIKDKLEITLLEKDKAIELVQIYDELILISSKIYSDIIWIQNQHRTLKRPFIFGKVDYLDQLVSDSVYYRAGLYKDHNLQVKRFLNKDGKLTNTE